MKTITIDDLKQRQVISPVAIFDVRGDVKYEQGHIPGAKTAPLGSLVFRVASIMKPDSFVAVYSDGEDDLDEQAVHRLEDLRLRNVHRLEGGLKAWREAGNQIVLSPNARLLTHGPAIECRPVIVDRETAYGGVFSHKPSSVEGAGG